MHTRAEKETLQLARDFARDCKAGQVIALHGNLGVGKTIFAKGVISALTKEEETNIQSPTFNYLCIYQGIFPIYHFDLYRIKNHRDFTALGFTDYLADDEGLCLIEWPERIEPLLPTNTIHISFAYAENGGRLIDVSKISC